MWTSGDKSEVTREEIAEALENHDRQCYEGTDDKVTEIGRRYYLSMAAAVLALLQRREGT